MLFFNLLVDISNSFKPQLQKVGANDGKSSVETVWDDQTINEEDLEEEKEEINQQLQDLRSMMSEEQSERSHSVAIDPIWNQYV